MSERSDISRVLETWMGEGPSAMPDRIVDVVADRISVQHQRRPWRLTRRLPMNPLFKLGVAAAAVLVIAVIGWNLLPGRGSVGGPNPTPSPTPRGTPVEVSNEDAVLSPGRYRWHPFADSPTLSIVADVPDGWRSIGPLGMTVTGHQTDAPTGMGIAFMQADSLFSDGCHWDVDGTGASDQPGDVEVGPTVNDLVDALRANSSHTSSTPKAVTFGEFQGSQLEIQLPADLEICDKEAGTARYYVFPGSIYAQGDGNRWGLSIVDVDGTRVIIAVVDYEGTPTAEQEAARAIVKSLEFTP